MIENINFNLHSHTARCGHAGGTDEEYVQAAIARGLKVMGFSDHAMLPVIHEPGMRGEPEELEDYIASVKALKKRYASQIDVKLGMECEYHPHFASYYRDLLDKKGFDYLIMGEHSYYENGTMHWFYAEGTKATKHYTDLLIEGMESGLFLYVAHPDLMVLYSKKDEAYVSCCKRIITRAKELGIPLEINMGRSRNPYRHSQIPEYSDPIFWDLFRQIGGTCLLGIDAHMPDDYLKSPYGYFEEFIRQYKLQPLLTSPI